MNDVTVTGLTRIATPKANTGGNTILAFFDCRVNGLAMNGCALIRSARFGITAYPPKLEGAADGRRSVVIIDEELRANMTRAAKEAYRLLGGADIEEEAAIPANADSGVRRIVTRRVVVGSPAVA